MDQHGAGPEKAATSAAVPQDHELEAEKAAVGISAAEAADATTAAGDCDDGDSENNRTPHDEHHHHRRHHHHHPDLHHMASRLYHLHTRPLLEHLIPTSLAERHHVRRKHGRDSWQARVLTFLHSRPVTALLMGLLILDILILCVELFLDAVYPSCQIVVANAISCCPPYDPAAAETDGNGENRHHHRQLASESSYSTCEPPLASSPEFGTTCKGHPHALHTAHLALWGMTIAILSLFVVELLLLIVTLGPETFFCHIFYVVDFFVVTTALALEVVLHVLDEDEAAALAGLLVIARLWRFVRIGHGLVGVTAEITDPHQHDHIMDEVVDQQRRESTLRRERVQERLQEKSGGGDGVESHAAGDWSRKGERAAGEERGCCREGERTNDLGASAETNLVANT